MSFEKIVVLLPGRGADFQGGGLSVALDLSNALTEFMPTEIVYYKDIDSGGKSLDEAISSADEKTLFLVTWGPDVEWLVKKIISNKRKVMYFAQSTGWNVNLPRNVPLVCVSRHVLTYWISRNPFNPVYVLSPIVEAPGRKEKTKRDIDILFIKRKSTEYLKNTLIPLLEKKFNVVTVDGFIDKQQLIDKLQRTKVYLYSSREHGHKGHQWVEGFGLQPLEALICGCTVFSNLHGGLADHMDPAINMKQIEFCSLDHDVDRISHSVINFKEADEKEIDDIIYRYSKLSFTKRLSSILSEIVFFFDKLDSIGDNGTVIVSNKKFRKSAMLKTWVKNKVKSL